MSEVKRNILRDLAVYFISSAMASAKGRKPSLFFKDIKYFSQWWKYRKSGAGTLSSEIPWLVFDTIPFLRGYLTRDMKIFEYGSGGSTIFFSKHVTEIISIEHDEEWYKMVKAFIRDHSYANINYRLSLPVPDSNFLKKDYRNPDDFVSVLKEYHGKSFEQYVKEIAGYKDDSFDLVIIDGRARTSCIKQAIPKIKKGGLLLLDNADRSYYLQPFQQLNDKSNWKKREFHGHFPFAPASVLNTTIIFQRLN